MAHGPDTDELLRRIAAGDTRLNNYDMEITSLPATLPLNLLHLNINDIQLTELPPLPHGLQTLNVYSNQLTRLPALPNTLISLFCGYNQLTALPDLPATLKQLACDKNQLTVLPTLSHTHIYEITCEHNLLTEIPTLPATMTNWLYCGYNRLTTLPSLFPTLRTLVCEYNQLTVLPALPPALERLYCVGNPISRVTLPFPNRIIYEKMAEIFRDTRLQYFPNETLIKYEKRMMKQSALASAAAGPSATRDAIDFAPPRDFGSEILPGGQGYIDAKNSFTAKSGKRTRRRRRSKKVVRR